MRRLAQDGARQVVVREAAIRIVRDEGAEHDPLAQLAALFRFVRDRIFFVGDVAGVETLQSPRYTLSVQAGDCDDRATLLVALARAIGIPADFRFKVIAANPRARGAFSHVFVVARLAGRTIALDPTYRDNLAGYEYPRQYRSAEVPA